MKDTGVLHTAPLLRVDELFDNPETSEMEQELEEMMDAWSNQVLTEAVDHTLDYLFSFVGGTNPPPASDPDGLERPMHPGGWSDIKTEMVNSYFGKVEPDAAGGWRGEVGNDDPDAPYLEGMKGYYVVTGINLPDGPLGEAVEQFARQINPGNKIVRQMGEMESGLGTFTNVSLVKGSDE